MQKLVLIALLLVLVSVVLKFPLNQATATREDLNVTTGTVTPLPGQRFLVDSPEMRAYFNNSRGDVASLKFIYQGPTEREAALASGEVREQIGLKLRALDTCNTLYVMWHITPAEGIVVSAKRNPGEHTHTECHASGYTNIVPSGFSTSVARLEKGEMHELTAVLVNNQLSVYVDAVLVWWGNVPAKLLAPHGLAGMRSDNVKFEAVPSWSSADLGLLD